MGHFFGPPCSLHSLFGLFSLFSLQSPQSPQPPQSPQSLQVNLAHLQVNFQAFCSRTEFFQSVFSTFKNCIHELFCNLYFCKLYFCKIMYVYRHKVLCGIKGDNMVDERQVMRFWLLSWLWWIWWWWWWRWWWWLWWWLACVCHVHIPMIVFLLASVFCYISMCWRLNTNTKAEDCSGRRELPYALQHDTHFNSLIWEGGKEGGSCPIHYMTHILGHEDETDDWQRWKMLFFFQIFWIKETENVRFGQNR